MKRLTLVLALAMVALFLGACGEKVDPAQSLFDAAPVYEGDNTIITEEVKIAPFEAKVEIIGENGASLPYYTEMVCVTDGMLEGDGALMFYSIPNYLPQIAEKIPTVELGEHPEIRATAREGVSVSGGETVNIYGEDFSLLAEDIPVTDLIARGKAEWAGKTVYLYFTVTFRQTEVPDYHKQTTDGYFVKTTLAQ